jgi:hypothetical protein
VLFRVAHPFEMAPEAPEEALSAPAPDRPPRLR